MEEINQDPFCEFMENFIMEEELKKINLNKKEIASEDIIQSNCLALTIKKDYKLTSIANVINHSFKILFKISLSGITLNIFKFFI